MGSLDSGPSSPWFSLPQLRSLNISATDIQVKKNKPFYFNPFHFNLVFSFSRCATFIWSDLLLLSSRDKCQPILMGWRKHLLMACCLADRVRSEELQVLFGIWTLSERSFRSFVDFLCGGGRLSGVFLSSSESTIWFRGMLDLCETRTMGIYNR